MHSFFFFSQVSSFFSFFLFKDAFYILSKSCNCSRANSFQSSNEIDESVPRRRGRGGVCEVKLDIAAKYLKEARSVEFR